MGAAITIPDLSSISTRSIEWPQQIINKAMESGRAVMVDSTGLKHYSKDEWHQEKYEVPAWCTWRKLHLLIYESHWVSALSWFW